MMKITLLVSGREMTFSEEELVAILEKHFDVETTQQEEKDAQKQAETEVVQTSTKGKWFKVKPTEIDQRLFDVERTDIRQETTRTLIREAFHEMARNQKYVRPFKTMIPEKTWKAKDPCEIAEIACNLGDHMADWVEQALEWAQRIDNGETWETICTYADTANYYRMIKWKNGCIRLVGGSRIEEYNASASSIGYYNCVLVAKYENTVPLVVDY